MRYILELLLILLIGGIWFAIRFCVQLYRDNKELTERNREQNITTKLLHAELQTLRNDFKRREADPFYTPEK